VTVPGRVWDDGTVTEVVATAGRVWLADAGEPSALPAWRTGADRIRNVGEGTPPGARLVEPWVEGAYQPLGNGGPTRTAA
jgi:hypothetical protein